MYVIGVDVGGTSTRVALFDVRDSELRAVRQVVLSTDPDRVVGAVARALGELVDEDIAVAACGIGVPEYVHNGEVLSSMVVQLPRADLEELERAVAATADGHAAVQIDADVRCAAVAEWSALEDDSASMLYVSLGTGLSCALVGPGGECWEGTSGGAISLGEWPAPPAGVGLTPATANLEQFASGRGIEHRFLTATGRVATCQEIAVLAADGDTLPAELLSEAGLALGAAVRQLYAVLDPTYVVVGGGLGSAATPIWSALLAGAEVPIPGREPVDVRQAALGSQSGTLGAALTALRSLGAGPLPHLVRQHR